MQKKLSQLIFRDEIRRHFAEVGELPDGSKVSFMRPLRHAAEMQYLAHAFVKRPIEVRRMRASSFAVRCLASGSIFAFSVGSAISSLFSDGIVIRLQPCKNLPVRNCETSSIQRRSTERQSDQTPLPNADSPVPSRINNPPPRQRLTDEPLHASRGHAGFEINVVRRGRVNGAVHSAKPISVQHTHAATRHQDQDTREAWTTTVECPRQHARGFDQSRQQHFHQ